MATYEKRGDLQWRARVRHKGCPETSRTFLHKKDAEQWARDTEASMSRGTYIDFTETETTLLSAALDRYAREISSSKKSWYKEKSMIHVIKKFPIANLFIAQISGGDVADYRDARLKLVGPKTVRNELTLIQHVFNIASKEWRLPLPRGNPVLAVRKPSPARPRDRRLESGEESRLLAAAVEYGGSIHDVVLFALETAMRRGEIAGIHWQDIRGNTVHLEDTKNGERRDVPLSSAARSVLAEQVRQLHDDRVFGMKSDSIGMAFRRVCKRAGIENLRFHDLRHEATSRLFEKGLNPMQVAAITGHKTLQMLKRYTHLRAEDLAKMLG